MRGELLGDMGQMEHQALNSDRQNNSGELSNMPIHMADAGTDNYEQEFSLGLIENERKMLADIDLALRKISNGNFGICEGTGKPIERARLDAMPYARSSIEYARMVEKGMAPPINNE